MSGNRFDQLRQSLSSPDALITDLSDQEAYFHDATEATGKPEAVVMARTEADVVNTIKFCRQYNFSVVARGAGTGLSGGCVPTDGSIILSTENLVRLSIDAVNKSAVCGPGVITKDLMDAASDLGLCYPPDPASYKESTMGGNVAENAGGLRCKRFGVTKDYVLGIRAVTAEGEILLTGDYLENGGFNLCDILIASEGTLAVITEISVRLINAVSSGTTMLAAFDLPRDAAQTVADITGAGIIPTVLEFLDGDAAKCSNQYEKTEGLDDVGALLLIETNGDDKNSQAGLIEQFCQKNRCSYLRKETDSAKVDRLWAVRRNLSKAVKESAAYRISEDVVVNNSKFPELVSFVAEMRKNNSELKINSFGHAGDGNLHVNFLAVNGTEHEKELIEVEIEKLLEKAVALGGSLTGEHGVGLAKRDYMPLEFDAATLNFMREFKHLFDPKALLNPGKIFPQI